MFYMNNIVFYRITGRERRTWGYISLKIMNFRLKNLLEYMMISFDYDLKIRPMYILVCLQILLRELA